ncbi:hypothetical protein Plhal304r1_c028g0092411 [Plasmopara halstedii]
MTCVAERCIVLSSCALERCDLVGLSIETRSCMLLLMTRRCWLVWRSPTAQRESPINYLVATSMPILKCLTILLLPYDARSTSFYIRKWQPQVQDYYLSNK